MNEPISFLKDRKKWVTKNVEIKKYQSLKLKLIDLKKSIIKLASPVIVFDSLGREWFHTNNNH